MAGNSSERFSHYRPLMVIFLITMVVWLAWALSDSQTYSAQVKVELVGADTAQYAVVSRDSTLQLTFTTNGYGAVRRYLRMSRQAVVVDVSEKAVCGNHIAVSSYDVIDSVKQTLNLKSMVQITTNTDSLRITLAKRLKKGMVPKLRDVSFGFADSYGLSGVPTIITDTVWLYGSAESLAKIKEIATMPSTIAGITTSDTFELDLNPVWKQYKDVWVSQEKVKIAVPSANCEERVFTIPIVSDNKDTSVSVKIYPDLVRITVLAPKGEAVHLDKSQFECAIRLDESSDMALVKMRRFPSNIRIKKIEPQTVRYVIIK